MSRTIFLFASLLSIMVWSGCTLLKEGTAKRAKGEDNDRFTQDAFRTPADTYRSVPFYPLTDTPDRVELDHRLSAFKAGGTGGCVLHSRTPPLSDCWFEAMDAGVKSSQRLGLDIWFYADGRMQRQNPDFQARCLARVKKGQPVTPPDTVLFEDAEFQYVSHVLPMDDPMNPDMVKALIDANYAPYIQRFGNKPHVRGIFMDAPQASPRPKIANLGTVSFSPAIPAAFKARTGRDLAPLLPSLFAETNDWRIVRLEYYRTIAACFENAFSKQIGDYCAANALTWTGHYSDGGSPTADMLNAGNLMQQLRHMGMPGISAHGLPTNALHRGKAMTSVANQYGHARRLSEFFRVNNHIMPVEDRMWTTAWHTLMGVNFISLHQPCWCDNRLFEEFFARLCTFAAIGQTEPEILVLNPVESCYIEHASNRAGRYDAGAESLMQTLMATHRNFDLGDEQILSEIATVANGRLVVGRMAYRAVILPPMLTIRASTIALLKQFAAQGGTILTSEAHPALVDGRTNSADIPTLASIAPLVPAGALAATLNAKLPPAFTLSGEASGEIWTHLRRVAGGHTLQLSNTSRKAGRTLALRLTERDAPAVLLAPVDGRCLSLSPEADGAIAIAFAPAQTWVLAFGDHARAFTPDAAYQLP